ncbi:hypothetical protein [Collimonas humicola]|uniref:hypothetical protein n=1 Tax=Collimonas humicola TaxID=2825886 RepID=UPI001B8D794B|nr:hypothetical protein [Collimonas humicola]
MKWGHLDEVEASHKLLYWVLMFVLAPYFEDPIDHWLKDILVDGGGLGGDPGWEMEHTPEPNGAGFYRVWGDPDMSGIEPAEAIYSTETVRHAVQESLLALSKAYPNKAHEAKEVIRIYNL